MRLVLLGLTFVFALGGLSACSCSKPCTPGQTACACRDGAQCDDGAVCGPSTTCVAPTLTGLQVSDPAARGCEVLLSEQAGTTVAFGQFRDGVVGTLVREAPRVAVTFVAPKNSPLAAGSVQLALASGSSAGVTVTKATCVDLNGAKLPAAAVSLH